MANAGYLPALERRQRILDAAKRVFAARGYHETSIADICDDLGIARGTLYQHFKSKADVFAAIIEDLLARVRAAVEAEPVLELPEDFSPPRELVLRFSTRSVRRILAAAFRDEASLRILVREAVGLDGRIEGMLAAIDDIVVDRFAEDLARAQRAGILRKDVDPRNAALFTLGGVQKIALAALARDKAINIGELALEATRIQLEGLLAPEVT